MPREHLILVSRKYPQFKNLCKINIEGKGIADLVIDFTSMDKQTQKDNCKLVYDLMGMDLIHRVVFKTSEKNIRGDDY